MKKFIALLSLVSLLLLTSCGNKEDQNVDTNTWNVQNEQDIIIDNDNNIQVGVDESNGIDVTTSGALDIEDEEAVFDDIEWLLNEIINSAESSVNSWSEATQNTNSDLGNE